jgi:anaerobic magnesium-protoporphyrin IX monomethyl ester cyclase
LRLKLNYSNFTTIIFIKSSGLKFIMNIQGKKKILIVEPPFYNFFGYNRWYYPITAVLVGTHFQEQGHDIRVYDADKPLSTSMSLSRTEVQKSYHLYKEALKNDTHPLWVSTFDAIRDFNPDVVGITAISAKIDSADKIAKFCKDYLGEKARVILGGPHAEGILKMGTGYNFGEYYDEVVTHIPNLVDRKPNKRLLIGYPEYTPKSLSDFLTSTGCPNKCTFCCNSSGRGMVYRNVPSIEQEVAEIKEEFNGEAPIKIFDDCFFSHEKRFGEIGDIIGMYGMRFEANARLMALSGEKIDRFMRNGGIKVYVGVESGSQRILDAVKKRLTVDDIIRQSKLITERKLPWMAFFIAGLPFETVDDLKKTEELAYKIQPTFISLNHFTPYPGTEIWKEYYQGTSPEFADLFQLNPEVTRLGRGVEEYMEKLFVDFDRYNKSNAQSTEI